MVINESNGVQEEGLVLVSMSIRLLNGCIRELKTHCIVLVFMFRINIIPKENFWMVEVLCYEHDVSDDEKILVSHHNQKKNRHNT